MGSTTLNLIACAASALAAASLASAESPKTANWQTITPSSQAATPDDARDELVNPLVTESSRTEAARNQQRLDRRSQVDFAMAEFGRISAPRRLGTVEHAYGQFAFEELASRDSATQTVALNNTNATRQTAESLSVEDLGLEFSDDTPDEVRRIMSVLLKGVDPDRSAAYIRWARGLSTQHLDAALTELSHLVQDLENQRRINEQARARLAQVRQSEEFRRAIAQLRFANSHSESEARNEPKHNGAAVNENLRGIFSERSEDPDRDREALRQVLLGRIIAPDAATAID